MNIKCHRASPVRRRLLLALAGLVVGGLALLPAAAADAHVRVTPDNPTSGSFSALTFRVPNESDTAGTVKVSVQLPQDHPFIHVSTKPITGWTAVAAEKPLPKPVDYEGTTITKAVRTVTWTADQGTQIRPGEYQEFSISVGPLPEPGTVMLPATQTYSDGTVVAWDQPTPDSAEEPDKPAPEFNVVAAAAGADHGGPTSSDPNAEALSTENSTSTETTAPAAADPVARTLGGLGLAAGLGGLVLGGLALRRRSAGGASS